MRLLKEKDYHIFAQLCGLTQNGMKKTLSAYLKSKYEDVIETPDYLVAIGDIPIALVAHMDTVFKTPAIDVFYDREKNVIWSPEGLGADDRAGIFAIMTLIRKGLRPHVVFTTDEEIGAAGAIELAYEECPFKDLRFVIQLDRRGPNDCVFYDCANREFVDYIEQFGFVEAIGTFTDICLLCPEWGVAGVNLSVGYRDEHSVSEVLFVGHLLDTIAKVEKILTSDNQPHFEYVAKHGAFDKSVWYSPLLKSKADKCTCVQCKKSGDPTEFIPAKTSDLKWHYYCIDCISDKVDWCQCCGEAYELPSEGHQMKLCEDCFYDFYYSKY